VINNTQPTIINSTNNTSTTLTSINTSSNTSIITIPPDQTNSITGLAASPLLTPSSIIIAPATATDAQITTTNDLSLMWWIIGGVILLLVIALIIVSIINSANQNSARKKNIPSAHHNLFGNIHPLTDIEGISQKYTRGLQTMGIKNTTQLREANATKVAHGTGASLGAVKSWQHMAELSSVKDIGPQYAELLEQSGIHSIDQLSSYNPDELLKLMNEKQDSLKISLQGNSADYATVEHWINEARDHQVMESEGEIA
jgi:predicted flap endonuclease-1-like 5' DNA nuclease